MPGAPDNVEGTDPVLVEAQDAVAAAREALAAATAQRDALIRAQAASGLSHRKISALTGGALTPSGVRFIVNRGSAPRT